MKVPAPTFEAELAMASECGYPIAGLDEVGRGPWAGPVVAAAIVIENLSAFEQRFPDIRDSKQLTPRHRTEIFERLLQCSVIRFALGSASVKEIDELNIRQATFLAMRRALTELGDVKAYLVDGNALPTLDLPGRSIVKGDQKSWSIATASIVAKVTRDREMTLLAREFPEYGWEKNAGYGTKQHQEAIHRFGVTPHHRRSFAPIRMALEHGER